MSYRARKQSNNYVRVKPRYPYLKLKGKGHNSEITGTAKTLSQAKKSGEPLIIKTSDYYYK